MRPDLRKRLMVGPVLAGTAIAALVWDYHSGLHLGWFVFMIGCAVFGLPEFRSLATKVAGPVLLAPMLGMGLALIVLAWAQHSTWLAGQAPDLVALLRGPTIGLVIVALAMVWTILAQMRSRGFERFFTTVALTCFGGLYIGVTCGLLLSLAMLDGQAAYYGLAGDPAAVVNPQRGIELLLTLITACKLGDVTAYFGGHAFGTHKMAPVMSPGKTWEGFACSFIGSIGGSYLVAWIWTMTSTHGPFNGWWQPAVWGLIIGPLGVVGDLAESCMKREAGVKDSGTTLPGFGGWLDIFDAIILAAPVGYVLALVL